MRVSDVTLSLSVAVLVTIVSIYALSFGTDAMTVCQQSYSHDSCFQILNR